jgi:toxin ParE1/3/4
MVQIIWTELAISELKEIYSFISKDSQLYAERQIIKIRIKTKILKSSKYLGKVVEEIGNPSIRELIEGNYRIIYKIINETEVGILTIHHTSRDLSSRIIE